MAIYEPPFPWLAKPAAVRSVVELIGTTAEAHNASVAYLRVRLGGSPPPVTILRVGTAAAAAVLVGRFLPAQGKILGLCTIAVVGVVYLGVLVATGEFGPDDRAKFARVLRRR